MINYKLWMQKYELAKRYYEYYGNLKVPYSFRTKDGIHFNEEGYKLGRWIRKQREAYRDKEKGVPSDYAITLPQIDMLNSIGMIWRLKEANEWTQNPDKWALKYQLCQSYYDKYGHLYMNKGFKTKDGVNYDSKGENLFTWLETQKKIHRKYPEGGKTLPLEYIQLLEKLDIDWDKTELDTASLYNLKQWQHKYELASAYFKEFGDLNIPNNFKTKDGVNYDEDGINLGSWVKIQRNRERGTTKSLKPLSVKEKEKLEKIGMIWDSTPNAEKVAVKSELAWKNGYEHASKYYRENGNLNVKYDYANSDNFKLGAWIINQRVKYKKGLLTEEQIEKLLEIGMVWEAERQKARSKVSWNEAYQLACNYRDYYNHLDIPVGFKTNDGVNEVADGFDLGLWIEGQRRSHDNYGLTDNRIVSLKTIGMVFYPDSNKEKMGKVCEKNEIAPIYVNVLSRLPVREVKAKIKFLKDKNIPIIEDDKLNQIFFMSNKNVEATYGVTFEKILYDYLVSRKK
ncbi:MAG: hypothetical protein E7184_02895 [Erysipelotrichaceae bacterium]|nr:hypothetical protein [Erysipelotrichaceae bacterium]